MNRITASLRLLCAFAAYFIGLPLLKLGCYCLGFLHVARGFAAASSRPWFPLLFTAAITIGPPIVLGMGGLYAWIVLGTAYPVAPDSLARAFSILGAVYAAAFAFGLFAGIVDGMAVQAAVVALKSLFSPPSDHDRPILTNPILRAVSLGFLGLFLSLGAASTVQLTVVRDLEVAAQIAEWNRTPAKATSADFSFGSDSLLWLATAVQALTRGNACSGLNEEDRVAMLSNGRALVLPAITSHPDQWTTETSWPLTRVYTTRCT